MEEKKKHYLVYKITNLVNGKIYIGQHETYDPNDDYMGSGNLIKRAIKKYGVENFKKEILFDFETREEMNQKEAELVNESFVQREDTYNIMTGGFGGFGFINKLGLNNSVRQCQVLINRLKTDLQYREQFIKAQSAKTAKAHKNPEVHSKMLKGISRFWNGDTFRGKHHTEESKRKIGETTSRCQKGSGNSQFGKHWYMNPETGESHSFRAEDVPVGWIRGRKISNHQH